MLEVLKWDISLWCIKDNELRDDGFFKKPKKVAVITHSKLIINICEWQFLFRH